MKWWYLDEKPQVTTRLPETSKSDRVPEWASKTCSDLRLLGSRRVTYDCVDVNKNKVK